MVHVDPSRRPAARGNFAAVNVPHRPPQGRAPAPVRVPDVMRQVIDDVASSGTGLPTVFIMRGVHGSGKSFVVNLFAHRLRAANAASGGNVTCQVVSSDNFFIQPNGEYKYDGARVGAAHAKCLGLFIQATQRQVPIIVVDNVNACLWEYENYQILAEQRGYRCVVIQMECENEEMLHFFHERNIHSVPLRACSSVMKRWENDPRAVTIRQSVHVPGSAPQSRSSSPVDPAPGSRSGRNTPVYTPVGVALASKPVASPLLLSRPAPRGNVHNAFHVDARAGAPADSFENFSAGYFNSQPAAEPHASAFQAKDLDGFHLGLGMGKGLGSVGHLYKTF